MSPEFCLAVEQDTIEFSDRKEARVASEQSVAGMQLKISRLQQMILETKTFINECCEISSLPPEMLSEIFMLTCQPKYNDIGGLDRQDTTPLRLGAVCTAWRNLVWSTSRLWACIVFLRVHSRGAGAFRNIEDLLAAWISRSRNQPLSIRFDVPDEVCTRPLTNILINAAPRWKNVSLLLHDQPIPYFETFRFPMLEHLSIRASNQLDRRTISQDSKMPQLKHLHLSVYITNIRALRFLTTFSVDEINNNNAHAILRYTSDHLENFIVHRLKANDIQDPGGQREQIKCPLLRRLVLNDTSCSAVNVFLSPVITPKVEDLAIYRVLNPWDNPLTSMPDFLNSLRNLQRLKITCIDDRPKYLISWVLSIDSLSELHFEADWKAHVALATGLGPAVPGKSTGKRLPLLERLTLECPFDDLLPFEAILEKLSYRSSQLNSAVQRLKSVSMIVRWCFKKDMDRFQTVADDGMEIAFNKRGWLNTDPVCSVSWGS